MIQAANRVVIVTDADEEAGWLRYDGPIGVDPDADPKRAERLFGSVSE